MDEPSQQIRFHAKYLMQFWKGFGEAGTRDGRMQVLKEFSALHVPNVIPYELRRKLFYGPGGFLIPTKFCLCCEVNIAQHRHHILALSHGGPNWTENLCPLCDTCHSEIHPHLEDTGPLQSVRQIMKGAHNLERIVQKASEEDPRFT